MGAAPSGTHVLSQSPAVDERTKSALFIVGFCHDAHTAGTAENYPDIVPGPAKCDGRAGMKRRRTKDELAHSAKL